MKNLRSLTWPGILLLIAALATAGWFSLDAARLQKLREKLPAPLAELLPISAELHSTQEITDEAALQAIAQGNQLLHQARLNLIRQSRSLTANLLQIIQTPDKTYRSTGRFAQAAGGKSRLELDLRIDQVEAQIRQISNGQVIWLVQELHFPHPVKTPGLESDQAGEDQPPQLRQLQIERIDLQRIQQLAESCGLTSDDPRVAREMLGGMTGLLGTLEEQMNFRIIRKAQLEQETFLVLEGKWKVPLRERNYSDGFVAGVAGSATPDHVRLYLRERDLLPVRYICLKKRPDGQGWYTPLAMELTDIQENAVIDTAMFNYLPTNEQVPNDITHESLHRLQMAIGSTAEEITTK